MHSDSNTAVSNYLLEITVMILLFSECIDFQNSKT